jgi:RNA polymerase sigma-70 factor (ECF subfamily)
MAGSRGDERAWIRGAQSGSVPDLEALFRHHWPRAYRAAYLVVHDSAAAEDIAQEAFLAADAWLGLAEAPAPPESEHAQTLATALAGLSPEHRAVIVMRHLLEYTPGEIAEALGLPRGTVNSRLRRGLDELAGRLEEDVR